MAEFLTDAWVAVAPKRLAKEYLAGLEGRGDGEA